MKYRKKPVEIEAMQWLPGNPEHTGEVVGWLMINGADFRCSAGSGGTTILSIHTLEGDMRTNPGDWIIRGVQNEFYPCRDGIFRETYDPVEAP